MNTIFPDEIYLNNLQNVAHNIYDWMVFEEKRKRTKYNISSSVSWLDLDHVIEAIEFDPCV